MVVVDLITGFLGAGKTTFIHKYLHYIKEQGLRVRMIENEFGDVSVDSQLLKDDDCETYDLAGLCMCCVGKEAFIKMLLDSAATACDRIIVEPSGIYDVDEFFEVMSLPEVSAVCEIGSILTIADATAMQYLTEEAKYLMFAQLLASGMVLLSKTQWMNEKEIDQSIEDLNRLMMDKGCAGGLLADICTKPWDDFDEDDYEELMDAGYARFVHDREIFSHSETFQSLPLLGHCFGKDDLIARIHALFDSPSCGRVYRIKGFASDNLGQWYEVNCTMNTTYVVKSNFKDGVLVVIGQQLRDRELKELFSVKNTNYRTELF